VRTIETVKVANIVSKMMLDSKVFTEYSPDIYKYLDNIGEIGQIVRNYLNSITATKKVLLEKLEEFESKGVYNAIKAEPVKPSRRRLTKSLDDFKDMDKILTTSELLKAKIKSGEITQDCK